MFWFTNPLAVYAVIVTAILACGLGFAIVKFRQGVVFPWREKCANAVAYFSAFGMHRAAKIAMKFGTGNVSQGLDKLFELLEDLFGGKDVTDLAKEIRGIVKQVAQSKDGLKMLKEVLAEVEAANQPPVPQPQPTPAAA